MLHTAASLTFPNAKSTWDEANGHRKDDVVISDAELLEKAREAASHAYAPYSNFPVGAAILTTTGEVFTGCNVENASYGLTICAERNAVTTLVAATDSTAERSIAAVAIVGLKAAPCWPCGACRQVLREFSTERVIVEDENHNPLSLTMEELLSHSFGPEQLPTENPTEPAVGASAENPTEPTAPKEA